MSMKILAAVLAIVDFAATAAKIGRCYPNSG
jgi:hypothetical protein